MRCGKCEMWQSRFQHSRIQHCVSLSRKKVTAPEGAPNWWCPYAYIHRHRHLHHHQQHNHNHHHHHHHHYHNHRHYRLYSLSRLQNLGGNVCSVYKYRLGIFLISLGVHNEYKANPRAYRTLHVLIGVFVGKVSAYERMPEIAWNLGFMRTAY